MDEQLAEIVKLSKRLEKEEAKVRKTKEEIKALEEQLIPIFTKLGMQRARVSGRTVWLDRKVRASAGGDMEALCNTFHMSKDETLRAMVKETVNGNTLGAWVREFDPDNVLSPEQITKKLPKEVRDVINVTETINLRIRASE